MYVCLYVCKYEFIYLIKYVLTVCLYMIICMFLCMFVCLFECMNVHFCSYMFFCVCINVCTFSMGLGVCMRMSVVHSPTLLGLLTKSSVLSLLAFRSAGAMGPVEAVLHYFSFHSPVVKPFLALMRTLSRKYFVTL